MAGRSIKIFLVDGNPGGLRTVEVGLSTLLAVIAPRSALDDLRRRSEAERTGVYLLLGDDDSALSGLAVYIGEGDCVIDRILRHDAKKDFWHTAAIFVSKDVNLTKAHARRLEARLVAMATEARRANIENGNQPFGGRLPEADEVEMTEVISQIRLVLGTVGFDVFAPRPADEPVPPATGGGPAAPLFTFGGDEFEATMTVTPVGFAVAAGSRARKQEVTSLQERYRKLRTNLLVKEVLTDAGASFMFTTEYVFNSPSAAATVVSGRSTNGNVAWKLPTGQTYGEWERDLRGNA